MAYKPNARLFNNLMKLAQNDTNLFYFKDEVTGMGTKVRIFCYYALMPYTVWKHPGALESRGIMFEIDDQNRPVRILSRPMEKFFNAFENEMSNVDWKDALYYMTKVDGSLISSFEDNGYIGLKSKGSIWSDHAYWAMEWLNEHIELKARVLELAINDYTVNFEYTGPKNRIILGYEKPNMTILNVRNNSTGEYVDMDEIYADPILRPYMVDVFVAECSDEWYNKAKQETDIEGYVIAFPDKFVKVKTQWYLEKFAAFDAINSNKQLMKYCIENKTDDIRSVYFGDAVAEAKISAFEKAYSDKIKSDFDRVFTFYNAFRHYDRRRFYMAASMNSRNSTYLCDIMMYTYGGFNGDNCIESLNNAYLQQLNSLVPEEYK